MFWNPGRSRNLIWAWVRPTYWSWRVSQKGRKQLCHPGNTAADGSHSGELLSCGHWQTPVWDSAWSSFAPRPGPTQQSIRVTSARISLAKQLTGQGHSSAHQHTGCLKTTWDHSCLWMWPYPPEGPGPNSIHQWAGTNPRIPWAWMLSFRKPVLASGPASATRGQTLHAKNHSPRACRPSLPTSKSDPALRTRWAPALPS